ncbi:hypothetical protein DFH06DRAFT_173775 [Mycena polygramma]|nr:hypothetical protein DFH06DRAFT_173775 [Mycena polygramma]
MSNENGPHTVNYSITGGKGGEGGRGSVKGGNGGIGEGAIFNSNINAVANLTNNITMQGQGLVEILGEWLEFPAETKDRQYELRSLHHKATGHWLFRDVRFNKWKDTPGSLWIKGISGTGKSVLSSTVIENIIMTCPERSAVAYFYFDFRNERRRRMDVMLRSIIWQLSGKSHSRVIALFTSCIKHCKMELYSRNRRSFKAFSQIYSQT